LNWQQQVGCAFLEAQGYVAGGVQSLVPDTLSGNFSVPDTCGSTAVSVAVKQQQLSFDAGGRSVLAVIAKGTGSSGFFFGRGASKVRIPAEHLCVPGLLQQRWYWVAKALFLHAA
jgi:hypothetical protein